MKDSDRPILEVRELRTYFGARRAPVRAVDGVSFSIGAGETVALVGESGCGKSVTALSLARLVAEAGFYAGGEVLFGGEDVLKMAPARLRRLRGAEISYVFQEPATSLNPVFRVGDQIAEAVRLHRPDLDAREETIRQMRTVGLPSPEQRMRA